MIWVAPSVSSILSAARGFHGRGSLLCLDFLATEPIVLLLAIYIAIAYATLYAFFAAYPIVFQEHRHFSAGEGGLAFLGIGLGNIVGLSLAPAQNRLYWRAMDRHGGKTIPEAYVWCPLRGGQLLTDQPTNRRLYLPMLGGVILPISLFWFAWYVYRHPLHKSATLSL